MVLVSLFKTLASIKKVNIVVALTTEADKPAIKAKTHNKITTPIAFITYPFFKWVSGCKRNENNTIKIPTCNPETAKICEAPAF